jgi:hypothetical protein
LKIPNFTLYYSFTIQQGNYSRIVGKQHGALGAKVKEWKIDNIKESVVNKIQKIGFHCTTPTVTIDSTLGGQLKKIQRLQKDQESTKRRQEDSLDPRKKRKVVSEPEKRLRKRKEEQIEGDEEKEESVIEGSWGRSGRAIKRNKWQIDDISEPMEIC